jgi:hypothetical protein
MTQRLGDIRVIGLVAGTHVLEDISRDVPYGVTVTIPGELAVRSKDLWRAISQKCVFQLPSVSSPQQISINSGKEYLEAQVKELSLQVQTLANENRSLRESLQSSSQTYSQKLDTILSALQNKAVFVDRGAISVSLDEVADGTAPVFIPSKIRPEDVSVRIDVQGEVIKSDVSSVVEQVRRVRKKEF